MPTRILREGIITSEAVNSLNPESELFYRRLMSAVDDYGRFHSHASLIRGACYPLQLDRVSDEDVERFLDECVNAKLIFIYANGKCIQVVKFNQQRRAKSKFPQPSESELLSNVLTGDTLDANQLQLDSYIVRTDSTTTTTTPSYSRREKKAFGDIPIPLSLNTPVFLAAWVDWVKHLSQKGVKTTDLGFEMQLKNCEKMGVERAIAAIYRSIEHCWRSIYEQKSYDAGKNNPQSSKPTPAAERNQFIAGHGNGEAEIAMAMRGLLPAGHEGYRLASRAGKIKPGEKNYVPESS